MNELTGSAKIADDAIAGAERFLEKGGETARITAWLRLAYAALRIFANMADSISSLAETVDHHSGSIVTRQVEY